MSWARAARWVAAPVGIAMSVYHLYAATFGTPEALIHRGLHLAFALILTFLLFPARPGSEEGRGRWLDPLWLLAGLAAIGYLFANYQYVVNRFPYADSLSSGDLAWGIVLVVVVLEAARRTLGPALPITAGVFLAYAWSGPYLPGPLQHRGYSLELLIDQMFLVTEGIFGIPLAVSATYVILFVIFGAFLEKSGAGQLFLDFASAMTGGARGGPGKVSCISSGLFGTVSGSAVANVMVDGWFTIPMMKRAGFRSHFAAAVEAAASTGGQIMPPIMGAAAFIMAEFLRIPYLTVAKHALIPAVLYYLALFMAVHFEACRTGLRGVPREELPAVRRVLVQRGHLFVPLAVLIYVMVLGYTPMYAAIAATAAVAAVVWLRLLMAGAVALARPRGEVARGAAGAGLARGSWRWGLDMVRALEDGAKNTVPVAAACACAGIVIGVVTLTGLGLKFTSLVLAVAGDSLVPALVLTMFAGILLGMGLPTTPAYIIQSALLIPALIKLGVVPVAAHLFVFYFAILSAITPPVALAVYAAAGISKTPMWATGTAAIRLGATGFIVPFMFVYGPSLLFLGSWWEILTTLVSASVGVTCLAASLHGWLWGPARMWQRVVLFAGAINLIVPGLRTDLVGLGLLAVVLAAQRLAPLELPAVLPPAAAAPQGPAVELDAGRIDQLQRGG